MSQPQYPGNQQPPQQYPPAQYPPQSQYSPQPPKKKGFPVWGWIIVGIVALGVFGAIAGGGGKKDTATNPTTATSSLVATNPTVPSVQTTVAAVVRTTAVSVATNPTVAAAARTTAVSVANSKGKVGETLSQNGYLVTVNKVERANSFSTVTKAKEGKELVAVDVTIQSDADKGVSSNLLYCTLKDSDGFKYNVQIFSKDPTLAGQNDIPKGDKVRGWATFEVPIGAKGLVFEYKPLSFTGNVLLSVSLEGQQ